MIARKDKLVKWHLAKLPGTALTVPTAADSSTPSCGILGITRQLRDKVANYLETTLPCDAMSDQVALSQCQNPLARRPYRSGFIRSPDCPPLLRQLKESRQATLVNEKFGGKTRLNDLLKAVPPMQAKIVRPPITTSQGAPLNRWMEGSNHLLGSNRL